MDNNKLEKYRLGINLAGVGNLSRMLASQTFSGCKFGITPEQFSVLATLYDHDDLYQRQISAITLKDRPNVSRIIGILENKGYVTKTADVNGRKVFKIALTEDGRNVYLHVLPQILNAWAETVEAFSDEEIEIFHGVLIKIKDKLLSKVNIQL